MEYILIQAFAVWVLSVVMAEVLNLVFEVFGLVASILILGQDVQVVVDRVLGDLVVGVQGGLVVVDWVLGE